MEMLIQNEKVYLPDYEKDPLLNIIKYYIIIKLNSVTSEIETYSRRQVLIKTYSA